MRLLALSFCLLILTFGAASAQPAAVNDAGAQRLKSLLQDMIIRQKNAYEFAGGQFRADGDIGIEQAGTYYAVTLPHITTVDRNGRRGELGMIAINASPGDTPGNWKMSVAMPTPVTYFDTSGAPVSRVDFGAQRMAGVWNEELKTFVRLDAAYENIRVEDLVRKSSIAVGALSVVSDLTESQPGTWSGPASLTFKNIAISGGTSIRDASLKMHIYDLSAMSSRVLQEKIQSFAENTSPADLEDMNPARKAALFNMMVDLLKGAGNGFTSQIEIGGFQGALPAIPGVPARTLSMARLSLGTDMTGFRDNAVTLGLRLGYEGFSIAPAEPVADKLYPDSFAIDVSFNKLPFDQISQQLGFLMQAGDGPAGQALAPLMGMQALLSLPQVMAQAGSNAVIKNGMVGNETYAASIGGTLQADGAAVLGATGSIQASIAGLDPLIETVQANAATIAPAQQQKVQESLRQLRFLQSLAPVKGKDEKGRGLRTYDLQLTKEGQILLNGQPFNPFSPGAGSPAPR